MLKENAGTQNEGRRNTKTNAEEVGKTRSEDKRETITKVEEVGTTRSEDKRYTETKIEESRTQGTALCMGLICPGYVWNSGYTRAGPIIESQWRRWRCSNRNTKRSPMDVGVGTKRRIRNPKCKHDTERGGTTAKLLWKFLELWPADY